MEIASKVSGGALLATFAFGLITPPTIAAHLPCPRKGAELIASDRLVRVYAYPSHLPTEVRHPTPRRTEACLVGRGTRMTLFDPAQPNTGLPHRSFGVVAISGTIVAYSIGHFGVDSGGSDVVLADIASRRVLRELPGSSFADAGFLGGNAVTSFVLDPSGSAAWIDERYGPTSRGTTKTKTFVVHAAPIGREEVVLDEGAGIGAGSLTLAHGTLTWWDGGVERSAPLRP